MPNPAYFRMRAILLGILCCLIAACSSSSPGPTPASLTAARTAQESLDRVRAAQIAGPQLTHLDRLVAMADVAWERGERRQAQFYAEEALATLRLVEAMFAADAARVERDTVHSTIVRLREEVGLGRPQPPTPAIQQPAAQPPVQPPSRGSAGGVQP